MIRFAEHPAPACLFDQQLFSAQFGVGYHSRIGHFRVPGLLHDLNHQVPRGLDLLFCSLPSRGQNPKNTEKTMIG